MNDIKITCLGHGNAFSDPDVGNSAYLVEYKDSRMLLDCGSTVPTVLKEMNIDPGSLTSVLISHLHADHVGGLERLLYHRRFISLSTCIDLGMQVDALEQWEAGQLEVRTDQHLDTYVNQRHLQACQYTDELSAGAKAFGDIIVAAMPVSHGPDIGMACASFLLTMGGTKVYFSGDTVWPRPFPAVTHAMEIADLILHEVEFSETPSGVHTHHKELRSMSNEQQLKLICHHHALRPDVAREQDGYAHFMGLRVAIKGDVVILSDKMP